MLARVLTVAALLAALAPGAAQARDPITPLRDVARGMRCTARTVVQGTAITTFDVDVLDVLADVNGLGPRILVRVSGAAVEGTGIASGFSGSPVSCPAADGRVGTVGAISATVGQYGNDVGLVTPIEQLLGLPARPPSGARPAPRAIRATARPVAAPLVVSGLAPGLAAQLRRAAGRAGRAVVAGPGGPLGAFPPPPLVPGASMGIAYATGALSAVAIGTVTYRDGATVYGLGHMLDGAGRRALPLTDAYVHGVIGSPLETEQASSYKLASPGRVVGTLSNDAPAGVVGRVGPTPPTTTVAVTVRDRDRGRTVRQRTAVADEVAVGDPTGPGTLGVLAPLALAQAVTAAFDGAPARESGRLCVRVEVRRVRRPLRACNRYVVNAPAVSGVPALATAMGNDLASALSPIESATFAPLSIAAVRVDAAIERGLRLATLRGVRGPRAVRRGQRVRLRLRVRPFQGRIRTVPLDVRIPRDAPLGVRQLQLAGTALDEVSEGGDALELVLDFGSAGAVGGDGPQSLADVRRAVARTERYDGLRARLGASRWRAGRVPGLRVDGRAALTVRVVR